jgi:hypothetical protein
MKRRRLKVRERLGTRLGNRRSYKRSRKKEVNGNMNLQSPSDTSFQPYLQNSILMKRWRRRRDRK